jgi:monoamine oxidase
MFSKIVLCYLIFFIHSSFSKDVIIIGAGVSGLSAAKDLQSNGGFSLTLLEARNRIGGRIYSDYSFGYSLDLGAAWIHGITGNEVYTLANKNNVTTKIFDYEDAFYFSTSLIKNDLVDAGEKLRSNWDKFKSYIKEFRLKGGEDTSVANVLESYLKTQSFTTSELTYLKNHIVSELENEYGNEIKNLSVLKYDSGERSKGEDVLMPDGYIKIFEPLASGLNIKFETIVSAIFSTSDGKVTVETNKGKFIADSVIVTLPLGVLKSNKILFDPPLSSQKKLAIEKMSFGTLEKFVVEFTDVFWDSYNLFRILNLPVTPFNWFVNFYKVGGNKTLIFLIAGNAQGLDIYSTPKQDLEKLLLNMLKTIFQNENIQIARSLITNWKNDPYSMGAYTSFGVGSDPSMVTDLAKREGNVFFAGEHTNLEYIQSVRGAFISGKDAAQKIINDKNSSSDSQYISKFHLLTIYLILIILYF